MKSKRVRDASTWCVLFILAWAVACGMAAGQVGNNLAPGAPGGEAHWPGAGKQGVGTSNTLDSKVWFTLREGVMTEVFFFNV